MTVLSNSVRPNNIVTSGAPLGASVNRPMHLRYAYAHPQHCHRPTANRILAPWLDINP